MPSAKEIKRKITSIKNTGKITKAMELISTVKMKKAQDLAMSKKEFVLEILKMFFRVRESLSISPLFNIPSSGKTLGIIVTSNKGLCGGYNVNVMKRVNTYMKETGERVDFISLGKKGALFTAKTGGTLIADYSGTFTDYIEPIFIKKISQFAREKFLTGEYTKVTLFYTHFVNTIKQIAINRDILPITEKEIEQYLTKIVGEHYNVSEEMKKSESTEYIIEPSTDAIVNEVIPIVLDMMFYDAILEAKASEHSSRMIAMKSAKDNAKKIAGALTLKYNKARQAMITKEVSEITGGVEALKD